jgi:hypothetical protein
MIIIILFMFMFIFMQQDYVIRIRQFAPVLHLGPFLMTHNLLLGAGIASTTSRQLGSENDLFGPLFIHVLLKMITLPRQARDKHRENQDRLGTNIPTGGESSSTMTVFSQVWSDGEPLPTALGACHALGVMFM